MKTLWTQHIVEEVVDSMNLKREKDLKATTQSGISIADCSDSLVLVLQSESLAFHNYCKVFSSVPLKSQLDARIGQLENSHIRRGRVNHTGFPSHFTSVEVSVLLLLLPACAWNQGSPNPRRGSLLSEHVAHQAQAGTSVWSSCWFPLWNWIKFCMKTKQRAS